MAARRSSAPSRNDIRDEDRPIHDWYRFVLSFPPHLVREYFAKLTDGKRNGLVFDPFCGTGTTLVECKKSGTRSIGLEANPLAVLVSRVKTSWDLSGRKLSQQRTTILKRAAERLTALGLDDADSVGPLFTQDASAARPDLPTLTPDEWKLIPEGFLSPKPLGRLLVVRDTIEAVAGPLGTPEGDFFRVALATVLVTKAGNFAFGPEIYRTKAKDDVDVLWFFEQSTERMIEELARVRKSNGHATACQVQHGDARELGELIPRKVSCVICSPPYPNEKDYTRSTRVESVLLGLLGDKSDLRQTKEQLLRSNTRNVFRADTDDEHVREIEAIQKLCTEIEERRIAMGKTSGFEKLYHRVVAHYFGGMLRHFNELAKVMRPGGRCAYVVGDQMSFLMVHIKTAQLLAELAERAGFRVLGIDLWRKRLATASKVWLREEVLLLERTDTNGN